MRVKLRLLALVVPLAAAAAGCGVVSETRRPARVPDVTYEPLDAAEDTLDAEGLRYDAVGGGLFGIVVRSHWTVCRQVPTEGTLARHVTLYVARDCASDDWED
jgi:hypothetical protein